MLPHDEESSSRTPLLSSKQSHMSEQHGFTSQHIENEWESASNKRNPRNWTSTFKWSTVALVSFIEFMTTMPNFMYAPNITDAQRDLNTDNDTLATFSLTIYILGFGLGPLLFAPLSEMYGRAKIYRSCLSVFLLCTAGCAVAKNIEMLVAFRFLAGCLGAAPVAIGGAVVGDLFEVSKRGAAMSVYQAGQIISAVIGPPIGGVVGNYLDWRWAFWIVCILSAVALLCSFVILQETHAPTLKAKLYGRPDDDAEDKTLLTELRQALSRPLKLLFGSPVVALSCVLIFVVIGILNVFLTEMSRIYQKLYGMSSAQSGTVYFGLALGFVLASILFGLSNDKIMHKLAERNKGETQPEFRLPAAITAMPTVVVGLLVYGWSLHFKIAWIVPTIGSGIAGLGITTVQVRDKSLVANADNLQLAITTYLVDSFDTYSASALAAITMARSLGGAIVPLLGPVLYRLSGQGWGNSVFAVLTLLCSAAPILLYMSGARWRASYSCEDL